jgi:hypothetical protein
MKKFILISAISLGLITQQAKALDGEIIFRDAMYGTAIGAVGGLAVYAINGTKDFGPTVGTGVLLGLLFGVGVGIYESQTALVEIDNGKVHVAVPEITFIDVNVAKNKLDTITEINLLGVKF